MQHPNCGNIYLIAYPRSGSNWLRYCFEYITKRQARSREGIWETGAQEELMFHLHYGSEYNLEAATSHQPAIILLRNYKECVYSHLITSGYNHGFSAMDGVPQVHLKHYQDLVSLYEKIQVPNTNLIIYYEEFIQKPKETLEKLLVYVDNLREKLNGHVLPELEMKEHLSELINNFDYHRSQCLGGYRGTLTGADHSGHALSSSPQASNPSYYSERSSTLDLKKVDSYMYNNMNQDIYETYLARYREKE